MASPAAQVTPLDRLLRAAETAADTHNLREDTMPGELKNAANDLVAALDSKDADRLLASIAEDVQGVDEISRRWLRGRSELDSYLGQVMGAVSDVRTELRDAEERVWSDSGVLTCWLDQDYTYEGSAQHISAPTTMVFRREGGEWKLAVLHSVPLPEQ
jgi:ketosteroid isomerase-like protein